MKKKKYVKLSDIKTPYMDCTTTVSADDLRDKFIETADVPNRDVFQHGPYSIRPREIRIQRITLPLPLEEKRK